ncbi:uncharacterized protein LOC144908063 [Branchiostoma floridae x Branchiostoma belcheri]
MGKKKQTKVTKKGGLIYSKAEWKEEYPAFRSGAGARGGGDENLVPRRPKKPDRERRARPYSEPVLSEINVDEPYDEEKAKTLDRPGRPKSVMVGGPEGRMKSPSRQPSRNLLSCLQIPEELDEDEVVVQGDVPRIVVEEVDQPPTKRARQEPIRKPRDVPMETDLPIEAIHLAGPPKPGRDAKGSPAKPAGTGKGTEGSLERRGPGTKGKPGDEGRRGGTPEAEEKGKKKKVFGGKKKGKEDAEKGAQEGEKKKEAKEKKKEKERKNKKAAEKEREGQRQSPEGEDGTLQLREASLDRDPRGKQEKLRRSPEAVDDQNPALVERPGDDLVATARPVDDLAFAPADNMAAAPYQPEARVQAAPAFAARPEILPPRDSAPSDAARMIKISFPVEQGVQTSPKSPPTSPTYLSPTSARPGSPESSPEHRRDGERGRPRQRKTPEGGQLEGEFLRRRSPLGDRYIVEKARLLDANVTPTDYAKMEAELASRETRPNRSRAPHPSEIRSGAHGQAGLEYLVIGGLEHRSVPTQTTSSVFSRPSYTYTDTTADHAPDTHAVRKVITKEISVPSFQDVGQDISTSSQDITTSEETITQEYKLYSSSSSFKTIEMYGAKFTLVGPTPTVVTETMTTSHHGNGQPDTTALAQPGTMHYTSSGSYSTSTSYTIPGGATTDTQHLTTTGRATTQPGANQTQYTTLDGRPVQYTTSASYTIPGGGTTHDTQHVTTTGYVSRAATQQTQYTTQTGYVTVDGSPVQYSTSASYTIPGGTAPDTQHVTTTSYMPGGTTPDTQHGTSTTTTSYIIPGVTTPDTQQGTTTTYMSVGTTPATQHVTTTGTSVQYAVPHTTVVRREAAVAASSQTVQKTKAANREAAVVESSQDFEIRPLKMEEEVREEVTPKSPEVIVSNLSPVRETVATFEQPSEGHDPGATSQYKLNYMHFPGRDTTITVVKRLSAGPTTLEGGEGGAADLQAEVKPETKTVMTEVKSEVRRERVAEVSAIPAHVKVTTDDLQEPVEARYQERAVDVPPEKASAEEEGTADLKKEKEKKKKKKRSWFRKGSSSSTSDDHSDVAEKPVAVATDDDGADAGVAMATTRVEAAPERGMMGVEARVEPRETPEVALHAGKAEAGRGGAGDDLVGKVVMVAEVKPEPTEVLKDKLTGEGEEMRSVGREITDVSEALQVLKGSEADMTPVNQPVNQPVSRPITAPRYSSPVNQNLSQPIRAPAYGSPVNQAVGQPITAPSYSSPVNQNLSQPIRDPSSSSPVNQPIRSPGLSSPVNQNLSQPIRDPSSSSPVNQASSQPIRAPEASSNRPGELMIELEGQRAAVPLSRQDRPYERLKNIIEAIDRVLESEGEAKASSALPLHQEPTHPGTSRTISVQTMQASSSLSNKEVQTDEEVESEDDFLEVWAGRSPHAPSDRVIISRVPARRSSERRRGHTHADRRPTRDEVMTHGDLRPTQDEVTGTHDDRRPTLEEITVYRDGGCQTEFESDPELASPQDEGRVPQGQGREPGSPYEKWRWEEINVVIKHQQGSGKTDVEGVETTWKRVPDVGDGEGEETTGVFDDSYRANNWIYVGDDEELPSAQSTPKGSPVMHSMGTSTDDDDGEWFTMMYVCVCV